MYPYDGNDEKYEMSPSAVECHIRALEERCEELEGRVSILEAEAELDEDDDEPDFVARVEEAYRGEIEGDDDEDSG